MQNSLKINSFDLFIGQKKLISTLKIMIKSSQTTKKQLDHIIFYGPPGLGKTTLANILASELNTNIRYAQGPLLEKKSDIISLFSSLKEGDIIFIDEIHGINKNIEELMYSALEENVLDIILGVEGESKLIRMKLPKFTLIGATTKIGKISSPLKDRFGLLARLNDYSLEEIQLIIKNTLKLLNFNLDTKSINLIAEYSQNVPRIANNFLKRILDFKIANEITEFNFKKICQIFENIGIFKLGLNEMQVKYLLFLKSKFQEFLSIETISGILNEEKNTIEQEIEPILIKNNLILKNSKGRSISQNGISYLKNIIDFVN